MDKKYFKKYYGQKKLAKIVWPKSLKSWLLADKLKSNFSVPIKSSKNFAITATDNVSWRLWRFEQAPANLQKKFLANWPKMNWLSQALLAVIKDYWLVEIKFSGQGELSWQVKSADLAGVFFSLRGNGEITITEHQATAVGQLVLLDVGEAVNLHYSLNKRQTTKAAFFSYYTRLAKQASSVWEIGLNNQAGLVGSFITYLLGAGSESNYLLGARLGSSAQTYLNFINQHQAQDTTGDMLIKTVGEDKSQTIIEGLIDIGLKSANTNSYLQEDALLLSQQARASALPNLEILNRDVKASHGATVGRIDEAMLYYLMSRGLTKSLAKEMIVSGFFQSLSSKIKDSYRQAKLFDLLLVKDINK